MTEAVTIRWDACDRTHWDTLLAAAGRSALEQSWAFGAAHPAARARRGIVARAGKDVAAVQVIERRLPLGITLAQIIRGPVGLYGPPDPDVYGEIRRHYRLRDRALLFWMPELADGPDSTALVRAAGLRQMTTGYSTSWIDLERDEDALRGGLDGKWRNMVRAAESSPLEIDVGESRLEWLLANYDAHRKARRYAGPSGDFIRAMAQAGAPLVLLCARLRTTAVAGVLFVRHGAAATYYVGWTDDEGRQCRAHNLLLWRGMIELRRRGVRWLDTGGINAAAPGVARFKLGMGGSFVTLSGTYL